MQRSVQIGQYNESTEYNWTLSTIVFFFQLFDRGYKQDEKHRDSIFYHLCDVQKTRYHDFTNYLKTIFP